MPLTQRPRHPPAPATLAAACLLACGGPAALAQTPGPVPPPSLALEMSTRLTESLPPASRDQTSTFVLGERISGEVGGGTVIEGEAELRRHDLVVHAQRIEHTQAPPTVRAEGGVRINREGDRFESPSVSLRLDTYEGRFEQARFSFLRTGGHGEAARIDLQGKDRLVGHEVRYTTCKRAEGSPWQPDWYVSAKRVEFDQVEETGTATMGVVHFKGVPLLAAPWVSFPLSDRRKSGLLAPTFNLDNRSGTEITLPYYLNLAPNRDATLYPTFMSRRGLDLAGEFRYLEDSHAGVWRAAYLPNDRLRQQDRWAGSIQHQHVLPGVGGSAPISLRLDLNRVSDDNYWRDFPRTSTSLTERLLPSQVVLGTGAGAWSLSAGVYRWQTLQDADPKARIRAPYDRVPSVSALYRPAPLSLAGVGGWSASVLTEATTFRTDRLPQVAGLNQVTDVNGTRWLGQLDLHKTWQSPGGYVRPGVRLHARQYQLDEAVGPLGQRSRHPGFVVPTATLDTGLLFDRRTQLLGRDALQTLEPRLFYAATPFREQGYLPVYDSAAFDFNLATVFSPDAFAGHDRVADLNALTLGLTSRLISPESGVEWASLGVAQRLRLRDQNVVLPDQTPIAERVSDLLIGGALQWTPEWSLNGTVQYNPKNRESVRTVLGGRYHPGPYRVVSAAYRLQRQQSATEADSEQIDVGWQWPLRDLMRTDPAHAGLAGPGQWYSVGRVNFSLEDRRVVDLVAGFEYDAGCWIGRFVLERLQQSRNSANQRLLFQLEFSGFSRLGSNPLQTLREHVPRYQYLREQINPPSRFERYD
jgi:LPS-assembly protein